MLAVGFPQFGHVGCSPSHVRELCPPSPHTVHAMHEIVGHGGLARRKTDGSVRPKVGAGRG